MLTQIFTIGEFDCRGFSATISRFLGGNLGAAALLQQLYYWSDRAGGLMHDGKKFIYKTLKQWGDELGGLSPNQIRRFFKPLIDLRLIEVKRLNKKRWDQTNYYCLNVERLEELFQEKTAETIEISEMSFTDDRDNESEPSGCRNETIGVSERDDLLYTKNTTKNTPNNISTEAAEEIEQKHYPQDGTREPIAEILEKTTNTKPLAENQSQSEDRLPRRSTSEIKKQYNGAYWYRGNVQERLNPQNNLAVGEWTIEGKLDPKFHEWMAAKWLQWYGDRYKGDRFAARADVLSHFYNQPEKLPIRWQQYHEEYKYRFEVTAQTLEAGVKVDVDYQQRLASNSRAVSEPLSEEVNPVYQGGRSARSTSLVSRTTPTLSPSRGACEGEDAECPCDGHSSAVREDAVAEVASATPVVLTDTLGVRSEAPSHREASSPSLSDRWKESIPDAETVDNVEAYKPFVPPTEKKASNEEMQSWWAQAKKKVTESMAMPKTKSARTTEMGGARCGDAGSPPVPCEDALHREASSRTTEDKELMPEPVAINPIVDFTGLNEFEKERRRLLLNDWLKSGALEIEAIRLAKQTEELAVVYDRDRAVEIVWADSIDAE